MHVYSDEDEANQSWKLSSMEMFYKINSIDSDKCGWTKLENFGYKFMFFLKHYHQDNIPEDGRHRASMITLMGHE